MNEVCPSDEELGDFIGASPAPAVRQRIRAHIMRCERCRAIVIELVRAAELVDEPVAAMPPPHAGRYRLVSVLGMGAMGVVYAAEDPVLNRKVAIKLLKGTEQQGARSLDSTLEFDSAERQRLRLVRESQHLARVVHPNVVSIYDVGRVEGQTFVAMELVEGGTFREWMREGGYSFDALLERLTGIGAGLAAVHSVGLVHRDLKPENVLIGLDGRPRVSDFGLARGLVEPDDVERAAATTSGELALTRTGALLGTPAYMAPEQLRAERADAPADVFAFCVIAWEALFGVRPFVGFNIGELEANIRAQRTVGAKALVPDTPRHVRRVLLRGLSLDPKHRPSIAELLRELEALRSAPTLSPRRLALRLGLALLVGSVAAVAVSASVGTRDQCAARPFAARFATAMQSSPQVARFVERLDEVRGTACEQTFVRWAASRPRFTAQSACLDRLGDQLQSTLDATSGPEAATQQQDAIDRLRPPTVCLAVTSPPLARELDRRIATAEVIDNVGRAAEAASLYRALRQELTLERDARPLGLVLLGEGRALLAAGQGADGLARLEEGLIASLYASDFESAALAQMALLENGTALSLSERRGTEIAEALFWTLQRGHLLTSLGARGQFLVARWHERAGRVLAAEIAMRSALALATDRDERRTYKLALATILLRRQDYAAAARTIGEVP